MEAHRSRSERDLAVASRRQNLPALLFLASYKRRMCVGLLGRGSWASDIRLDDSIQANV